MSAGLPNDAALAALAALPAELPAPPIPAGLEAELGRLTAVVPRRPLRQLALLFALSLLNVGGLLAMLTLRPDMHELPMLWLVGVGAAWLAGFAVPLYLAIVPRPGSALPRWKPAMISALVGAVGFIVLGFSIHPSGPSSVAHLTQFSHGYGCLEYGLATAVVPVIAGALLLRGTLPIGSRAVAAAIGAGGGSLGGLMLHLHCPVTDPMHVGLMHGGAIGVAALIAALLVPRATELR